MWGVAEMDAGRASDTMFLTVSNVRRRGELILLPVPLYLSLPS